MKPPPPPRLEMPPFTLRAWSTGDAGRLRATLETSDAHLREWTPWVIDGRVAGLSLEERLDRHAQAFEQGSEWVYGIFSPADDEVLGGCGLFPRVGPGAVEIGYWLSVNHTGRGLATAAAAALTRVAFAAPDIHRVEIRCAPGNVASQRVPERLGYRIAPDDTVNHTGSEARALTIWKLTREEYTAAPTWPGNAVAAVHPPFDLQPVLRGELVELAPLRESDRAALFAVAADPLIWEQHPERERYREATFRVFFDDALASGGALLARDRRDGRVIGSSRFHGYDAAASAIEIGWTFLARSHWGGSYNRDMKELMLRHAFRCVERVVFVVGSGNVRSQRAVLTIGGILAGRRADGRGGESLVYEITRASRVGQA